MDSVQENKYEENKKLFLDGKLSIDLDGEGDFWLYIGGYPISRLSIHPETRCYFEAFYFRGTPLGDKMHMKLYTNETT